MSDVILYVLLGLIAGALSGLIGIGGGVIIVPALVFLFGLSQHQAQGTTLALMVPPIGILEAWTYYQEGLVGFENRRICLLRVPLRRLGWGKISHQLVQHPPGKNIRTRFACDCPENDSLKVG